MLIHENHENLEKLSRVSYGKVQFWKSEVPSGHSKKLQFLDRF